MADSIRNTLGVESELIKGAGGIFDVEVDGNLLYSKHETGRFPENQEVIELINST